MHRAWKVSGAPLLVAAVALVGVLPGARPAAAAAPASVTITPENARDTAVHDAQRIRVSGSAPGAVRIERAEFVGFEVDGDRIAVEVARGALNRLATPPNDFLRVDSGQISGSLTLPCIYSEPEGSGPFDPDNDCATHDAVRRMALRVTVSGGTAEPGESNELRVDFLRPLLTGYEVVTPTRIIARFDEPVRHPQGDSPSDWEVQGREVLAVEGSPGRDCQYAEGADQSAGPDGCTRGLVLNAPLGEDDEPAVTYTASEGRVPGREKYVDRASNQLFGFFSAPAVDRIVPRIPTIETVDGQQPRSGRTTGGTPRPEVEVGGIKDGHTAELYQESGTTEGFQPSQDRLLATAVASGGRARLVPDVDLPQDVDNLLHVVAVDGRNRSGAASVVYVYDLAAPALAAAVRDASNESVTVLFTEPVDGTNSPLDWRVVAPDGTRRPVTAVSGEGDRRRLQVRDVPAASQVFYEPVASSSRYRDRAGRTVDNGVVLVGVVPAPVLLSPTAPVVTTAEVFTIRGTSTPGSRVDVLTSDGRTVGTVQLLPDETSFVIEVPLARGARNDFTVHSVDRDTGERSPGVRVPTITQDADVPRILVTAPRAGEVVAGGQRLVVTWQHDDANPGLVTVQLAVDGTTFQDVATVAAESERYELRAPGVNSERARVRLVAADQAGRTAADTSNAFVVDALAPFFTGVTRDARTVVVRLSEAGVTGSSSALDWRVEGEQVSQATQTSEGDVVVVRLTTGPGVTIQPDQEPIVEYTPQALTQQYRDRAGQLVQRRQFSARDGILPVAPSVTAPTQPVLTKEAVQRVTGRGAAGDRVELIDPFGDRVAGPTTVAGDGTWSLDAPLRRDTVNDLRARSLDLHENRSATAAPVARIEQDSIDPTVTVTEPRAGARFEPGQRVAVRWASTDRNLVDGQTLVQASTDGGETFTTLGNGLPASGSLVWTVPDTVTPRALLRVSTPDRAGRTGRGSSGLLGIGTAAAPAPSTSPTAGAGTSPSANPGAGSADPLSIAVSPARIVPGQLSTITVSGGLPGTQVELQAYSRPSTEYQAVRSGVLGPDGTVAFQVRPGTNTRLFAQTLEGDATSRTAVVNVSTALSLTVVRNGRRDYTFQGRILPRRSGQLITLYRVDGSGREIIATQLRTDATGTYRIRRLFTGSGRFGFLTRTGQTLTNAAGVSNGGRARPTEVF